MLLGSVQNSVATGLWAWVGDVPASCGFPEKYVRLRGSFYSSGILTSDLPASKQLGRALY